MKIINYICDTVGGFQADPMAEDVAKLHHNRHRLPIIKARTDLKMELNDGGDGLVTINDSTFCKFEIVAILNELTKMERNYKE